MTDHPDYPSSRRERADSASNHQTGTDTRGEQAQERARETADNVKDSAWKQAQSQYEQQSGFAADQTEKMAAALRRMADEFEQQDQPAFSSYASKLAGYSDSMSDKLRGKDLNAIMNEVQDVGRRQPALVVGGAIATGFLLARFLRSSQTPDSSDHTPDRSSTPRLSSGAESRATGSSASDQHGRL